MPTPARSLAGGTTPNSPKRRRLTSELGTLVEIWLQREFRFSGGLELDFSIAGTDVDCKWSRQMYGREIPMEMYSRGNKLAMVVWANEYTARWSVGLIRISEPMLRPMGRQRDKKRRLSDEGRDSILWVFESEPMIENVLVRHPEVALEMNNARSGRKAVEILFRRLQGVLISHSAIETAGQQIDSSRRARECRDTLAKEGIVIFGHYAPHPDLAEALGLPRPSLSRWVSARLSPSQPGDPAPSVTIDNQRWTLAKASDPISIAPRLPDRP